MTLTPTRNALLTQYMYCNILYHNTLSLQAVRTLATMAHFFKQMYSDNILLLKEFTPSELTTATTVQLIEREIQRIADCTSLMGKIEYR